MTTHTSRRGRACIIGGQFHAHGPKRSRDVDCERYVRSSRIEPDGGRWRRPTFHPVVDARIEPHRPPLLSLDGDRFGAADAELDDTVAAAVVDRRSIPRARGERQRPRKEQCRERVTCVCGQRQRDRLCGLRILDRGTEANHPLSGIEQIDATDRA